MPTDLVDSRGWARTPLPLQAQFLPQGHGDHHHAPFHPSSLPAPPLVTPPLPGSPGGLSSLWSPLGRRQPASLDTGCPSGSPKLHRGRSAAETPVPSPFSSSSTPGARNPQYPCMLSRPAAANLLLRKLGLCPLVPNTVLGEGVKDSFYYIARQRRPQQGAVKTVLPLGEMGRLFHSFGGGQ